VSASPRRDEQLLGQDGQGVGGEGQGEAVALMPPGGWRIR